MSAIALIAAIVLVTVAGATAVDGDPSTFQVDIRDESGDEKPDLVFMAPEGETFTGSHNITIMEIGNASNIYTFPAGEVNGSAFYIEGKGEFNASSSYYVTLTSSGGQTLSAIYTPSAPEVSIELSGSFGSGSIADGTSSTLSVSATPEGLLEYVDDGSVVWSSSPEGVVQISGGTATGCSIEALQPGDCTIGVSFTIAGTVYNATFSLTVNEVEVSTVTVSSENSVNSIDPGAKLSLTATVAPSNATHPEVTWSSSDVSIATVDQNGVVTGVAPGSVTITAVADGVSGTFDLTVNTIAVTGISITDGETLNLGIGEDHTLSYEFTPANATNKNVTWASGDSNIVAVSDDGTVTGVAAGTATITVTTEDGSKTDTISITVVAIPVTGIEITDAPTTMKVGEAYTLGATISPANASTTDVVWSSSNTDVLSVNNQGVVTALKSSDSPVTITATITDQYGEKQTYSDTVEITVVPDTVPTHTITIVVGDGGSVSPSGGALGNYTVIDGGSVTFTIRADAGYSIDTVLVDGVQVELSDGAYTFTNVTADHTLSVTFVDTGVIYPPYDDDDDYVPLPPVQVQEPEDDDTTTIVACAAAAVVAALMAVFLIMEYRKR